VKPFRRLRYVKGEQVKAGGIDLNGLPLAVEGEDSPVGEFDGLVIDLATARVKYLVVAASDSDRKHLLPLDATSLDARGHMLERVSSEDLAAWKPFDASAFERYDDDAMMSLLFGRSAA
jgi:hypothetical protein